MSLVWRDGVWRDSQTGDVVVVSAQDVRVGNALVVDVTDTIRIAGSVYVANLGMTWVSGKTAAPVANAVQADTGALAAGSYDFDVQIAASDTAAVGKGLVIEHRNAANGATLQTLGGVPAGMAVQVKLRSYAIAANERLRIIAGTAAGATSSMYVSAIGRRLS